MIAFKRKTINFPFIIWLCLWILFSFVLLHQEGAYAEESATSDGLDITLTDLVVEDLSGNLIPLHTSFSSETTVYYATVKNSVSHIVVKPTNTNPKAKITVNEEPVASGDGSGSIPLSEGKNYIPVTVTAENGSVKNVYTLILTREQEQESEDKLPLELDHSPYLSIVETDNTNDQDKYNASFVISGTSAPSTNDNLVYVVVFKNGEPFYSDVTNENGQFFIRMNIREDTLNRFTIQAFEGSYYDPTLTSESIKLSILHMNESLRTYPNYGPQVLFGQEDTELPPLVDITSTNSDVAVGTLNENRQWAILPKKPGKAEVTFTYQGQSEEEITLTIPVHVMKEPMINPLPEVVHEGTIQIIGYAEPYSVIEVTGGKENGFYVSDESTGLFAIDVPLHENQVNHLQIYSAGIYLSVDQTRSKPIEWSISHEAKQPEDPDPADIPLPELSLNGDRFIQINAGEPFVDPGAVGKSYVPGESNIPVSVQGTVDHTKPGKYTLVYEAVDKHGRSVKTTRTVEVVNDVTITLIGYPKVYVGRSYEDEGATATSTLDGDISDQIIVEKVDLDEGDNYYKLIYYVEDSTGQGATVTREVFFGQAMPDLVTTSIKAEMRADEFVIDFNQNLTIHRLEVYGPEDDNISPPSSGPGLPPGPGGNGTLLASDYEVIGNSLFIQLTENEIYNQPSLGIYKIKFDAVGYPNYEIYVYPGYHQFYYDDQAPFFNSSPEDGSTGWNPAHPIEITIYEHVTAGTTFDAIELVDSEGNRVGLDKRLEGTRLTLTPSGVLRDFTDYTLRIPEGALVDRNGLISAEANISFQTGEVPKLTVLDYSPASDDTSPWDEPIYFELAESIMNVDSNSIKLLKNGEEVDVGVRVMYKKVYIEPVEVIDPSSSYELRVSSHAVRSNSGKTLKEDFILSIPKAKELAVTSIEGVEEIESGDVHSDSRIKITFSQPVEYQVSSEFVELTRDGNPVKLGINQQDGDTLVFWPSDGWTVGQYEFNIPQSRLVGIDGARLYEDVNVQVTVQEISDPPPMLIPVSVSPEDGAHTENHGFTITFDQPMEQTVYFAALYGVDHRIVLKRDGERINASVDWQDAHTVVIRPNPSGDATATYTLSVASGTFKTLDGKGINEAFSSSYTLDRTAPKVTVSSLLPDRADSLDEPFEVVFDEPLVRGSRWNEITLVRKDTDTPVDVEFEIVDHKLLIKPGDHWQYDTQYELYIPEGALADTYGHETLKPFQKMWIVESSDIQPAEIRVQSEKTLWAVGSMATVTVSVYDPDGFSIPNRDIEILRDQGRYSFGVIPTDSQGKAELEINADMQVITVSAADLLTGVKTEEALVLSFLGDPSPVRSFIETDRTVARADGSDMVIVDVYIRSDDNVPISGVPVEIVSDDGSVVIEKVQPESDQTGKSIFHIKNTEAETIELKIGVPKDIWLSDPLTVTFAGLVVSDNTLTIVEGSEPTSYAISMSSPPTETVTVNVYGSNDLVITPNKMEFTPEQTSQQVSIRAVDDGVTNGDRTVTLTHHIESSDPLYMGLSSTEVQVFVKEEPEQPNRQPLAIDEEFSTIAEVPLTGTLSGNDPDGDPIVYKINRYPEHGNAEIIREDTGEFRYTPDQGWSGSDQFTFITDDGEAVSEEATVTIRVYAPANTLSIELNTKGNLFINEADTFTMSGAVTDPDQDDITVTARVYGSGDSEKSVTVPNGVGEWQFTWTGHELAEGTYPNIQVSADDGKGEEVSVTYAGTLTVDKTAPIVALTPIDVEGADEMKILLSVKEVGSGVEEMKWLEGHKTEADFAGGGHRIAGNSFIVKGSGIYSVYVKDRAGNTTIEIASIEEDKDSSNDDNRSSGNNASTNSPDELEKSPIEVTVETDGMEIPFNKDQIQVTNEEDGIVVIVGDDAVTDLNSFDEAAERQGGTVRLQLDTDSTNVQTIFSGKIMRQLAETHEHTVVAIQTNRTAYELPIQAIDIETIADQLRVNPDEIEVEVKMELVSGEEASEFDAELTPDSQRLSDVIDFSVKVRSGDRSVEFKAFGRTYVNRQVKLTVEELNPDRATVVYKDEQTGELRFSPSVFEQEEGTWEVMIKRNGNSSYSVVTNEVSFADMVNHWAKEDVETMASKYIVKGVSEATFAPDKAFTRAELTELLVRSLGLTYLEPGSQFSDVSADAWYASSVTTAVQAGLIQGYEDGTFRPQQAVTRQEMAVLLSRALEFVNRDTELGNAEQRLSEFADNAEIAEWAKEDVAAIYAIGITKGKTADTFAPTMRVTRAEGTVMIKRLLEHIEFINR